MSATGRACDQTWTPSMSPDSVPNGASLLGNYQGVDSDHVACNLFLTGKEIGNGTPASGPID
jgi:hypothetical protein